MKADECVQILESHAAWADSCSAVYPAWVGSLREEGAARAAQAGVPDPRTESWIFTDLPAALRKITVSFQGGGFQSIVPEALSHCVRPLSDVLRTPDPPEWARRALSDFGQSQTFLRGVNAAFLSEGIVIDVPEGVCVDQALCVSLTGRRGEFLAPRVLLRLGAGARLVLVEEMQGESAVSTPPYWRAPVVQMDLGAQSHLEHLCIQDDPQDALVTRCASVSLGQGASYDPVFLNRGAATSRHDIEVFLQESDASCSFSILNFLCGSQHTDSTLSVFHNAPACRSRQSVRSVLSDRARGVFQGSIHVDSCAQKTDGYQLSQALLLSDRARMDMKPALEIYADDVKCAHGATVGQMDEEALFYLRARGIPQAQARRMLVLAFLTSLLEENCPDSLKDLSFSRLESWYESVCAGGDEETREFSS